MTGLIGLKIARRRKGLTQKKLAELSGLSEVAICSIERGKMDPSLKTIRLLSKLLEVSNGFLIDGNLIEEASDGSLA